MVYISYHNISKIKLAETRRKPAENPQKTRRKLAETRRNSQNYNLKNNIFRYIIRK